MSMRDKFKCPSCGEMVQLDTMAQKTVCPLCNSIFDVEAIKLKAERQWDSEQDHIAWQQYNGQIWSEEDREGIETVFGETLAGSIKPEYIIPFKIDKNAAMQACDNCIREHKYVPKKFKSRQHIEKIQGIYVPFWLFSAEVDVRISFDGVQSLSFEDAKYHTSENLHHDVYREGGITFEHLPIDGCSGLPDDLIESIEPFDFKAAQEFRPDLAEGFSVGKYDEDEIVSGDKARAKIKRSTENYFRDSLEEYSTTVIEHSVVKTREGKVTSALYPVWILDAEYKGKTYTFAVNGQTGKFAGDLPVDKGALWKYFAKFAGIGTILLYLASMIFLWG